MPRPCLLNQVLEEGSCESLSARNVNLAQDFLCSKIQVINSSDHLHSTLQAQSILQMLLLITTVQRCVIVVRPFYGGPGGIALCPRREEI